MSKNTVKDPLGMPLREIQKPSDFLKEYGSYINYDVTKDVVCRVYRVPDGVATLKVNNYFYHGECVIEDDHIFTFQADDLSDLKEAFLESQTVFWDEHE